MATLKQQFEAAVLKGDLNAPAEFGKSYLDVKKGKYVKPTVMQEMLSASDFDDGVDLERLYPIIAAAANGEDVKAKALRIIEILSLDYAKQFVPAEEEQAA